MEGNKYMKTMLEYVHNTTNEMVEQAQDSNSTLQNRRQIVTPEVLALFPDSPTARRHRAAFQYYYEGMTALTNYNKDKVENETDCQKLQPAFHGYARGFMLESHMMRQFLCPVDMIALTEQYLKMRPNDILVKYLEIVCKSFRRPVDAHDAQSDYELNKDKIRSMEILADTILPFKSEETHKSVLISLYYMLGAHYVTTKQYIRALDSFEKCYALDSKNIAALYGVAVQTRVNDPEKAIRLLKKFIEVSPKCDEKYPNAYFLLGFLSMTHFKNDQEGERYYKLGREAEEKWRLPWQGPVDIPQRMLLEMRVELLNFLPERQKAIK